VNISAFRSEILDQVGPNPATAESKVACVTVCHNEALILPHFLDHYRQIGCDHFFIVDDHSTDGTLEVLSQQPDVTLFRPINHAVFRENVGQWREAILDHYCTDKWVTLPDLDEFLYFKQMPNSLYELAKALEHEGNRALLSIMVDMYADMPLDQHHFDGKALPQEAFPFFDGQSAPQFGMRIMAQPKRFLKRFPTPQVSFMGGARDRLFFQQKELSFLQAWFLRKFANMNRPLNPSFLQNLQNKLTRQVTKKCFATDPSVLNKFALLKWPKGAKFARAPHSISKRIAVSERLAVFLHFKFYKGHKGLRYSVERGQHAGRSALSRLILADDKRGTATPVFEGSKKFAGVHSLSELLR
jgi:hypothetical protein